MSTGWWSGVWSVAQYCPALPGSRRGTDLVPNDLTQLSYANISFLAPGSLSPTSSSSLPCLRRLETWPKSAAEVVISQETPPGVHATSRIPESGARNENPGALFSSRASKVHLEGPALHLRNDAGRTENTTASPGPCGVAYRLT